MVQTAPDTGFGRGAALYRPVCNLARGGMGQVDLCVRRAGTFERLYAVKRLHPHLREDDAMRSMFLEEARVAGLVRHANVVSVLDVGEDADGPYLVMDYIEGVSLSRLVASRAEAGDPLPIPLCIQLVAQVARGLHAAHELAGSDGAPLDLVHRDVSPQNILVGRDGVTRVTDFGIAKALGRSTHTSTGVLKGKVGYMSPEQLRFEPVDRRSDLFALGVVLHETVHQQRLYKGADAAEVARWILHDVPPDLGEGRPDVPPALVELAFELLAKDREDRPETAQDVADRLDELVTAYGEVVDVAGYVEHHFGSQLEAEHQRICELVERLEESAATSSFALAPTKPPPRSPARSRGWLAAGLIVAASGTGLALLTWGTPEAQAPAARDRVAASPAASPAPAMPVVLEVDSRPTNARVFVDEMVVGRTPLSLELSRGDDPVVVTIEYDGFVSAGHTVIPDRDQSVLVALTPIPEPSTDDAQPRPPAPRKRSRVSRPRRRPAAATPAPEEAVPRSRFRKFN